MSMISSIELSREDGLKVTTPWKDLWDQSYVNGRVTVWKTTARRDPPIGYEVISGSWKWGQLSAHSTSRKSGGYLTGRGSLIPPNLAFCLVALEILQALKFSSLPGTLENEAGNLLRNAQVQGSGSWTLRTLTALSEAQGQRSRKRQEFGLWEMTSC